jgi:hypothetical protein
MAVCDCTTGCPALDNCLEGGLRGKLWVAWGYRACVVITARRDPQADCRGADIDNCCMLCGALSHLAPTNRDKEAGVEKWTLDPKERNAWSKSGSLADGLERLTKTEQVDGTLLLLLLAVDARECLSS